MITCQCCGRNTREIPYECRVCHKEICGDCVGVWPKFGEVLPAAVCVDCDDGMEVLAEPPTEADLAAIRLAEGKSEEAAR